MTDPDLLKAITEGPLDNRRHCVQQLARHDLRERSLPILGACYVNSVSKADKPSAIYHGTMEIAVKMLGVVLEELVCTPDFDIRFSDFIERVHTASTDVHSDSRMRVYTNTSLRLLAAYGVLEPCRRARGRMQYGPGDLAKITQVYDVDPDNWKNQRMLAPSSRAISADELAEALRSMTPRQHRIITGENRPKEQPPAPPAEQQDESPEVLSADEQASDNQGPTEYSIGQTLSGDLERAVLHVWTEHGKLARSFKHQRVFYTDRQNFMMERLKGISEINEQLLKLSRQFEALCAALQWKPPA